MHRLIAALAILSCACAEESPEPRAEPSASPAPEPVRRQAVRERVHRTRVVVLGSGTPVPDPERAGPSIAVVVDDEAILVDTGAGVLRRAEAARAQGEPALAPEAIRRVLVTHLHSDHTLGMPEILLGGWVVGRETPLEVWGPPGTRAMIEHLGAAWTDDVGVRTRGLEGLDAAASGALVNEITEEGLVYRGAGLTVRAFRVRHGSFEHALGFRFEGPDRSVVISGDTAPSDAVVAACDGCDVLVHEAYAAAGAQGRSEEFRRYHGAFHTSGIELGALAARARPRLLVIVHVLLFGAPREILLEEVRASFEGPVVIADDLGVY